MKIKVHHLEEETAVLGPGRRYAVWTQGCPRCCPGCINPSGQAADGGSSITVSELAVKIANAVVSRHLTGVTVSGGEPFLQADALAALISEVKAVTLPSSTSLDFLVFTGYAVEELRERHDYATNYVLRNIDILIDGEYIESQNHNQMWRGSENQRFHFLSPKYASYAAQMYAAIGRSVEFVVRPDGETFIVGLPEYGFDAKLLRAINGEAMVEG